MSEKIYRRGGRGIATALIAGGLAASGVGLAELATNYSDRALTWLICGVCALTEGLIKATSAPKLVANPQELELTPADYDNIEQRLRTWSAGETEAAYLAMGYLPHNLTAQQYHPDGTPPNVPYARTATPSLPKPQADEQLLPGAKCNYDDDQDLSVFSAGHELVCNVPERNANAIGSLCGNCAIVTVDQNGKHTLQEDNSSPLCAKLVGIAITG